MIGVGSEPGAKDRTSIMNHDMKESSGIQTNLCLFLIWIAVGCVGLPLACVDVNISFCYAKVGSLSASS